MTGGVAQWEKIARRKSLDKAAESSRTETSHWKKQEQRDWKALRSRDGDRGNRKKTPAVHGNSGGHYVGWILSGE
ncbi:hypothetical protein BSG1_15415 [Bacillus sp. SG-1]|nr:hypothetical protein BSG1_15415 [Bacillus sp. SG-1]